MDTQKKLRQLRAIAKKYKKKCEGYEKILATAERSIGKAVHVTKVECTWDNAEELIVQIPESDREFKITKDKLDVGNEVWKEGDVGYMVVCKWHAIVVGLIQ